MSYNQGQQGYGQYNPYGQTGGNPYGAQSNNYPQQEQSYGHTGNYSDRPDLEHHSSSRYDEENAQGGNYEMSNMDRRDPNRILNEVRLLDGAIDEVESRLTELSKLQSRYLADPNASSDSDLSKAVETEGKNIMEIYRSLVSRVNRLKEDPDVYKPRNKAQFNKVERRLKTAINNCQKVDREYRQGNRENIARQYRIVRPDASDAEVLEAIEDTSNTQVFSQALISSDRRGRAQTIQKNVSARHAALQKIESDMIELAQLFNDLEAMVVQQEAPVTRIEEQGDQAVTHVADANKELDVAVDKAKAARRKKWWCLGIVALIIIIIVIVVVVVVLVTRK